MFTFDIPFPLIFMHASVIPDSYPVLFFKLSTSHIYQHFPLQTIKVIIKMTIYIQLTFEFACISSIFIAFQSRDCYINFSVDWTKICLPDTKPLAVLFCNFYFFYAFLFYDHLAPQQSSSRVIPPPDTAVTSTSSSNTRTSPIFL